MDSHRLGEGHVKGKNGDIGSPSALPLQGTVVLVPPRASAADCAVATRATCVSNGTGTKVSGK